MNMRFANWERVVLPALLVVLTLLCGQAVGQDVRMAPRQRGSLTNLIAASERREQEVLDSLASRFPKHGGLINLYARQTAHNPSPASLLPHENLRRQAWMPDGENLVRKPLAAPRFSNMPTQQARRITVYVRVTPALPERTYIPPPQREEFARFIRSSTHVRRVSASLSPATLPTPPAVRTSRFEQTRPPDPCFGVQNTSLDQIEVPAQLGNMVGRTLSYDEIRYVASVYAQLYRISLALVLGVIRAESNFNPNAVSSKGAKGIMQLAPGTAAALGVTDIFDPIQNIAGGSHYLAQQIDAFNGDLSLAVGAYNAGPQAVRQHGGIPPYPETQDFVRRVIRYYQEYETWLGRG